MKKMRILNLHSKCHTQQSFIQSFILLLFKCWKLFNHCTCVCSVPHTDIYWSCDVLGCGLLGRNQTAFQAEDELMRCIKVKLISRKTCHRTLTFDSYRMSQPCSGSATTDYSHSNKNFFSFHQMSFFIVFKATYHTSLQRITTYSFFLETAWLESVSLFITDKKKKPFICIETEILQSLMEQRRCVEYRIKLSETKCYKGGSQ